MAFAPYSNDRRGHLPLLLGQFVEKDFGHRFEYCERDSADRCDFAYDFPHRIFVGKRAEQTRVAKVLNTVAHIIVDEDENGQPVVEKWDIKQHRHYS